MAKHRKNYCEYLRRLICPTLHLETVVKVWTGEESIGEAEITACKEKQNKSFTEENAKEKPTNSFQEPQRSLTTSKKYCVFLVH